MKGRIVILTIIAVLVINACASQQRQAKLRYRYTTICEVDVLGTEAQSGTDVGASATLEGEGCGVGRQSHAKKEGDQLPD